MHLLAFTLETLNFAFGISAVHQPFYISICIWTLPMHHTTFISLSLRKLLKQLVSQNCSVVPVIVAHTYNMWVKYNLKTSSHIVWSGISRDWREKVKCFLYCRNVGTLVLAATYFYSDFFCCRYKCSWESLWDGPRNTSKREVNAREIEGWKPNFFCLFVCLSPGYLKKYCTDFHESLWKG